MSGVTAGVLGGLSLAASLAGTGLSYFSQQQESQQQQQIANYNLAAQRRNAEINAQMAIQQSQWQQQTAHAQYQAQQNNAAAYDQQALAVEAQGREEARRMREENERVKSQQRARYAGSGVVGTEGTPLAVMAESAAQLELGVQDAAYRTDLESRAYRRKAELERYESGFSLFDESVLKYEEAAARTGRSISLNQANLDYYSASSNARGMRLASYGTLLSGLSSAAASGNRMF